MPHRHVHSETTTTDGSQTVARENLKKFAWLSIAAALATISLKTSAWLITGSVGLLSDAAESVVNLVAAVVVLFALTIAARPADRNHQYGHTKAEYFSAAIEGQMIFVAALVIIGTSIERFLHPQPLEDFGVGLTISIVASVINGLVAMVLLRAGRKHHSLTLKADGKHLITDVWTSIGVVVGVVGVAVTGFERLDPIVAFLVGINIVITGWKLLQESLAGLMDGSLSKAENTAIAQTLEQFVTPQVQFHALRTRVAGHQRFAEVHVLIPGAWTVQQGHDLVEQVEQKVIAEFAGLHLICHMEPLEDPRSYENLFVEIPVRKDYSSST